MSLERGHIKLTLITFFVVPLDRVSKVFVVLGFGFYKSL